MKKCIFSALFCFLALGFTGYAIAVVPATHTHSQEEIEHGGGCRKSSPAGMCCHKNHSTGEVHCH